MGTVGSVIAEGAGGGVDGKGDSLWLQPPSFDGTMPSCADNT